MLAWSLVLLWYDPGNKAAGLLGKGGGQKGDNRGQVQKPPK